MAKNFVLADLSHITPVSCPCGQARRAFALLENGAASVHLVDISAEARPHYHRHMTEFYVVLEGAGHLELDGEMVPVKPLTTVMIRPGCRHRAVGALKVINMVVPPFDPDDEWFD